MGLHVHLLDLSPVSIAYLSLGGFIVIFSMISLVFKEKLYIGESVLATAFGIIIGPHCANIFDPRSWSQDSNAITLEVMRLTLALGLFAIGVELPRAYLARHCKSLIIMVVPTMALGWLTSAGFMFGLFPGLSFISALCVSACLTPTDPILAVAITSGNFAMNNVPINIRHLLAAESSANDGLAYPFLSISIYLSVEASKRKAIGEWFLIGWLYQVILGIFLGACMGFGFCHVMKYSLRKGFINKESYVTQYIALALMSIGLTSLLGSDDLLAAFAAGTAMSWDGHFNVQIENAIFSAVVDLVLNCAAFIYIGAWLPLNSYNSPELNITPWRLVLLFLCLLAFRRVPALLALYKWVPDIHDWREALFVGHFGPMGVGAIFISTLALTRLDEPHTPPRNQEERLAASLQPIVSFVVLGSIIIHGLSIPFFTFGRRTISMTSTWQRPPMPEWLTLTRRMTIPITRTITGESTLERGTRREMSPRDTLPSTQRGFHSGSSILVATPRPENENLSGVSFDPSSLATPEEAATTGQSSKQVGFETCVVFERKRVNHGDTVYSVSASGSTAVEPEPGKDDSDFDRPIVQSRE